MRRYKNVKRLILIGRSEAGKSTLIRALCGRKLSYEKTQAVKFDNWVIDTPGEYAETQRLGGALAVYSCEADVIGLVCSAVEPYSLFPPNVVGMATRPVIGIITKCARTDARQERARLWLENTGCADIFRTDSLTGFGIDELRHYLSQNYQMQQQTT